MTLTAEGQAGAGAGAGVSPRWSSVCSCARSSNTRVENALTGGASQTDALSQGFEAVLLVAAALCAVNVLVALIASPPLRPTEEQLVEAAAAA